MAKSKDKKDALQGYKYEYEKLPSENAWFTDIDNHSYSPWAYVVDVVFATVIRAVSVVARIRVFKRLRILEDKMDKPWLYDSGLSRDMDMRLTNIKRGIGKNKQKVSHDK